MAAGKPASASLILVKQVKKERDFSITPNSLYRDLRLDWPDLGMVQDLLHLRDGHQISMSWLVQRRPSGEFATRSITQRLQKLGYLRCTAERDEAGRIIRWIWQVCEWSREEWAEECRSAAAKKAKKTGKTPGKNPQRGKPQCGFTKRGKPRTKELNTEDQKPSTEDQKLSTTTTKLVWPRQLGQEQVVVILGRFEAQRLEPRWQQAVLDEFARLHLIGKPPNQPISWLLAMIGRAARGEFVPDAGLQVAKDRARRAREVKEQAAGREAAARATERAQNPQERLKRQAKMAEIAAEVGCI